MGFPRAQAEEPTSSASVPASPRAWEDGDVAAAVREDMDGHSKQALQGPSPV